MLSRGDFREYVVGRRRGDSRLRGNDGRGCGNDGTEAAGYDVMGGREWGNAKAQGRNERQEGGT